MEQGKEYSLETFEAAIRQQEKPVVVDFWASWSVPCLMNKERIPGTIDLIGDVALIGSVNIDDIPELTDRFSIITIPTTLIFYKEQIVKQFIGIQEPEVLQEAVMNILGIKKPEPVEEKAEEE